MKQIELPPTGLLWWQPDRSAMHSLSQIEQGTSSRATSGENQRTLH